MADEIESVEWYEIHDHGPGTERHAHSTVMTHMGDVNNPKANDHTGVASMSWDEWKVRVRGDSPVGASEVSDDRPFAGITQEMAEQRNANRVAKGLEPDADPSRYPSEEDQ